MQDVFIGFFRNVGTLRDASSLRPFLVGIALRTAHTALRKRRVRRWLRLSDDGNVPEVASHDGDPRTREALRRLYAMLDELAGPRAPRLRAAPRRGPRAHRGGRSCWASRSPRSSGAPARRGARRARAPSDDDLLSDWTEGTMSDARSGAARRLSGWASACGRRRPPPRSQQHLEGRARLIASVEKMRRPSRARPALVAFAFAAAVAAAVLLVVRVRSGRDGAPIAWHVENGAVSAQGYVSIPPTAPSARLVFDDGSDVAARAGLARSRGGDDAGGRRGGARAGPRARARAAPRPHAVARRRGPVRGARDGDRVPGGVGRGRRDAGRVDAVGAAWW